MRSPSSTRPLPARAPLPDSVSSTPDERHRAAASIPRATYRLQLHHQFTLGHATAILHYLEELGISDVYASPVFTARPQSPHGYDVCDPNQFNPDLGGAAAFDCFRRSLSEHHLELLLDIVPNHMGVDHPRNRAWFDVLQHGPQSPFARWFDINWQSPHPGLHGKILLPVLGDHFGRVLERGELQAVVQKGTLWIAYYDQRFPISPDSLNSLPPHLRLRKRDNPSLARLARQLQGKSGVPSSFAPLAALLDRQHYRLAFWRLGLEQLNYRRFFDITHLASLRMEDPAVFDATHQRIQSLIRRRRIRGLRIDHPDGLRDPLAYLRRLQDLFHPRPSSDSRNRAPGYVVVEKILADGETIPMDWPVAGTTGYEILNLLNNLFVDTQNETPLDQLHRNFTRCHLRFAEERYRNKILVLQSSLAPELDGLVRQLSRLMAADLHGRDFTLAQIRAALSRLIAALPIYRTYLDEHSGKLSLAEQRYWVVALDSARRHSPDLPESLFDLLGVWITLGGTDDLPENRRREMARWVIRLQQLTGPAMAKGLEDTTFYTWNRFISLNEVGGNPDRFGIGLHEFHSALQLRAKQWPHALTATATHDTKRGEDTRARLNVLSEIPRAWSRAAGQWQAWNLRHKTKVNGSPAPDSNQEYFLYQTLVGTWPLGRRAKPARDYVERIQADLLKSAREAKEHTGWLDPNEPYEAALRHFISAILDPRRSPRFLKDADRLVTQIALPGFCNSLSQTLLKLTIPGVPDIYQGTEFWDFSMVDPDNRRPIDYVQRESSLALLQRAWSRGRPHQAALARKLASKIANPQSKLFVLWRTLQLRAQAPDLFRDGRYEPMSAKGSHAQHVCAFRRVLEQHECIVVVPRFVFELTGGKRLPVGKAVWRDTTVEWSGDSIAAPRYQNVFTGECLQPTQVKTRSRKTGPSTSTSHRIPIAVLLGNFPVALLQPIE